jgi:hypothetical protein
MKIENLEKMSRQDLLKLVKKAIQIEDVDIKSTLERDVDLKEVSSQEKTVANITRLFSTDNKPLAIKDFNEGYKHKASDREVRLELARRNGLIEAACEVVTTIPLSDFEKFGFMSSSLVGALLVLEGAVNGEVHALHYNRALITTSESRLEKSRTVEDILYHTKRRLMYIAHGQPVNGETPEKRDRVLLRRTTGMMLGFMITNYNTYAKGFVNAKSVSAFSDQAEEIPKIYKVKA